MIYNETLLCPEKIDFLDSVYHYFKNQEVSFNDFIVKIKSDSLLFEKIKLNSDINKTNLDSELKNEALKMMKVQFPTTYKFIRIHENIKKIKSDTSFMRLIRQKAIENKISEEEMIRHDAIWLYENE